MWRSGTDLFTVWIVVCSVASSGCVTGKLTATHQRHVRETSTYWLDMMVLVDSATFQSWYGRTQTTLSPDQRRNEARADIKRYFTLVIQEVSSLYSRLGDSFRLNFRPVGFYFEPENTNQQWLVTYPSGQVDAERTLAKVTNWLRSFANQSQYDHALLFTGKDLATDNEGHTTGRGTVGTMCKRQSYESVSVIEDRGAFQSVFTAAHELAHSLDAGHDGVSNNCSGSDRYIMTAVTSAANDDNRPNQWFFSACTQNEIASFLKTLSEREIDSCLRKRLPQDADVPDVTDIVPGQLYGRDTQCQHLYGAQSSYCFFGSLSTICLKMGCRDPFKLVSLSCNLHLAATGTSCGNRKWCQSGKCIESPDAPAAASCVSDQTTSVNGLSCPQMASIQPALCYDVDVYSKCCQSCQSIDSGVEGCPYGNRKKGCSADACHKILSNGDIVDEDCCGTCRFNRETWTCQDVDAIDGRSCAEAVEQNGVQGCYNLTMAFRCCATCQRLRNLNRGTGCEYGDLLLQGCPSYVQKQCNTKLCCETCSRDTGDSGTTRPPPLLPSVLTLASVTYMVTTHWA